MRFKRTNTFENKSFTIKGLISAHSFKFVQRIPKLNIAFEIKKSTIVKRFTCFETGVVLCATVRIHVHTHKGDEANDDSYYDPKLITLRSIQVQWSNLGNTAKDVARARLPKRMRDENNASAKLTFAILI